MEAEKDKGAEMQPDVVVSASQWSELQARIEELESRNKPQSPLRAAKTHERTARVKFIDDLPVVGWVKDRKGNTVLDYTANANDPFITLILDKGGKSQEKKVKYFEGFLQAGDSIECTIIKMEAFESVKEYGTTTAKNVDYSGYRTVDTGREVALEVKMYTHVSLIKLPDGREVKIDNEFLNI